jgi:hypothetical protein
MGPLSYMRSVVVRRIPVRVCVCVCVYIYIYIYIYAWGKNWGHARSLVAFEFSICDADFSRFLINILQRDGGGGGADKLRHVSCIMN